MGVILVLLTAFLVVRYPKTQQSCLECGNIIQSNSVLADLSVPEKPSDTTALLTFLSNCESGNNPNIVVWDNGSWSYGKFQFKLSTFNYYGKLYGFLPRDLEVLEGENYIYDGEIQYKIAQRMISDGLEYNWKNCVKQFYD